LALDSVESQDYNKVRAAILKAYAVVPEQSRALFRTISKQSQETYGEFAFRLNTHFNRWIEGTSVQNDFEKLRELIKLEQFQQVVDPDLRIWLLEQKPTTLESAAKPADQYVTLRRNVRVPQHHPYPAKSNPKTFHQDKKFSQANANTSDHRDSKHNAESQNDNETSKRSEIHPNPKVRCFYCHNVGHVISQCTKRKADRTSNSSGNTSSNVMKVDINNGLSVKDIDPLYLPYCYAGTLTRPDGTTKSVTLLRDTGALQSLLNHSMMQDDDYVDTGERRFIRGVSGEVVPVPLAEVTFEAQICSGSKLCGIAEGLPRGIFGLIGNDLCPSQTDVYVTTRSQAAALQSQTPVTSSDDDAVIEKLATLTSEDCEINDDDLSLLFNSAENLSLSAVTSRTELIKLQQEDATLKSLFELASNQSETPTQNEKARYAFDKGVLVRFWRDRNRPHNDECDTKQTVAPSCLRISLLQLAHDIPAAGHLGQRKTRDRLLQHYYWPQVESAIKQYCRTCDRCQRLGKRPNPPKAP